MNIRFESSYNPAFLAQAVIKQRGASQEVFHVTDGGYNQIVENIMNPASSLYQNPPEIVVLLFSKDCFTSTRFLEEPFRVSWVDIEGILKEDAAFLNNLIEPLLKRLGRARVIVATLPVPPVSVLGTLERNIKEISVAEVYEALNRQIARRAQEYQQVYVFDMDAFVRLHGWVTVFDKRMEYLTKSPFSQKGLELLGKMMGDFFHALMCPPKKCIIVDLDDTLWGGIIGEDELSGIKIGNDGVAKAFYDFQRELRNFKDRGILLAVVSKNNEEDALEALAQHPGMVLRPEDFVAMRINWNDKASNIVDIANELNLGLNSFVFIDDNMEERQWVRDALPEVEVVDLPSDPAFYVQRLLSLPSLFTFQLTREDKNRAAEYARNFQRRESQKFFKSYEEYLRSLSLKVFMNALNDSTVPRITQLINKTNQFNLTTVRYTEAELNSMGKDKDRYAIFSISVQDRFGDYGLTGVAILKRLGKGVVIDTFLLSCRVLGKHIETAFLAGLVRYAVHEWACDYIEGMYTPSKKNQQTADFYVRHNFEFVKQNDNTKVFGLRAPEIAFPEHIVFASELEQSYGNT